MKKVLTICTAVLAGIVSLAAQQPASWLRNNCISPDGKEIAFSYQGDIFVVSSEGGTARQITSVDAFDCEPKWTPDGKSIVFASYREESKDIYITSREGGAPTRVTRFTGNETVMGVLPDGRILFSANIQQPAEYDGFPSGSQIYSINADGTGLKLETALQMGGINVSKDGVWLYEDNKGYEDPFRKHHTSSVTRDIWMIKDGAYTKMSAFEGEDRNPVFAADGRSYYFLSEKSGSINIWKGNIDTPLQAEQVSSFDTHPVRYISVADDGTIALSYNGALYTMKEGSEPRKLDIYVNIDPVEKEMTRRSVSLGLTDFAVSPNGKEVAVIAHGEVFVTTTEFDETKRITNTPERERGISFSEDGRTLYYASDRDGRWGIWKTSLTDKKDKYFTFSFDFKEERVTPEGRTCFQPEVSPDGKWLAFLEDRADIVIMDIKSGKEKVLLKGVNYSYTDGDQSFSWSPDSRYILCNYIGNGGWNNPDVALIDIESGKITDLTQSGYSDSDFRWALGGKAMTWASDKAGFRSHGSWGSEDDIYIMFFDAKAYYEFTRSKTEDDLEKFLTKDDKKDKKEAKDSTKTEEKKKVEKLNLDLEHREDRIIRLTSNSGRMGDHILSPDGTKLYYCVRLERGTDLCQLDIKAKSLKVIAKGTSGRFYTSPDGKEAYIRTALGVSKFDLNSGKTTSISYRSEYFYYPAKEREYIFLHAWNQVNEKFYDPQLHGTPWPMMRDNYRQFLPYIKNNFDFQELLSEMLGELNGSHTGARYYPSSLFSKTTGSLGLIYDPEYEGEGLKIKEVLPGSCLATIDPEIKAGDIILSIEGKSVKYSDQWYDALYGRNSKRTLVSVKKGGKKVDITVIPVAISAERAQYYTRWVRQREAMVEKLSGGKVGYVHVKSMDSDSYREVFSRMLGKYRGCDAVIVDTRHNGGGWLHDDLVILLSGREYIRFQPRGQYIGSEPFRQWTKPSCVLMCEDNYSDACGFPYSYKTLGIGKLIGAPVPGTMTAVWWETQLDSSLIFGVPQVGSWGVKEGAYIENYQIEPDILVYNDPASVASGKDPQLEAAVAEMLAQTQNK
ncbi:MAG: PD40 domain-containing protein [Bacteroidales bacterium]|nr:PD40 domain-containing protein [Bacteroidales bacterium]